MGRYTQVASQIKRLIREQDLRPGDPLPSERQLVTQLRTSYGTVRLANNHLCRHGVVERLHGRGTFVAEANPRKEKRTAHHRLGLLYVDMGSLSSYSQSLTFSVQRAALAAHYELVIDRLQSDDLIQGKMPEIIRRRSVDAVVLDGAIRAHHVQFLEDRGIPYVVTGNCPLERRIPQVRLNAESMTYQITKQLLQAGIKRVWLDVDLPATDRFYMGMEMFRGYEAAIREFGKDKGAFHLLPLEPKRMAGVVRTLCDAGLEESAFIVQNWSAPLLASAIAVHTTHVNDLLIVPEPCQQYCALFNSPNVLQWSAMYDSDNLAERAVRDLVAILEGTQPRLQSLSFDFQCSNLQFSPTPRMDVRYDWVPQATFSLEEFGEGKAWRPLDASGAGEAAKPRIHTRKAKGEVPERAQPVPR